MIPLRQQFGAQMIGIVNDLGLRQRFFHRGLIGGAAIHRHRRDALLLHRRQASNGGDGRFLGRPAGHLQHRRPSMSLKTVA